MARNGRLLSTLKPLIRLLVTVRPAALSFTLAALLVNAAAKIGVAGSIGAAVTAISLHNGPRFWTMSVVVAASAVAIPLSQAVANYGQTIVGAAVANCIRGDFHDRLLRAPLEIHDQQETGDLQTRLSSDIAVIQSAVNNLTMLLQEPLLLLGSLVYLSRFSPILTAFMIPLGPAVYVVNRVWQPSLYALGRQNQEVQSSLAQKALDMMRGIVSVKAYRLEGPLQHAYVRALDRSFDAQRRLSLSQQSLFVASFEFNMIALALVIIVGGWEVLQGRIAIGTVLVALELMNFIISPFGQIARAWSGLLTSTASWERIHNWQRGWIQEPEVTGRMPGSMDSYGPSAPELRLERVSFSYPGQPVLLDRVSLTLQRGAVTALVGANGSGKSTLGKLILRLYVPFHGTLWWDDQPLEELGTDWVRRHTVYLPQEPFFAAGSVRNNLLLVTGVVEDSRLFQALEDVGLPATAAFLDRELGEQAKALSGGERMRLAIARALLRDAPLWVLDEPTAGLDALSGQTFRELLRSLHCGRTMLLISHDRETVAQADVVLDIRQVKGDRVGGTVTWTNV